MDEVKTSFRHDLGIGGVIGAVARLGDDTHENIVAVTFTDLTASVRVGVRLRTVEQAVELVRAAQEALRMMIDDLEVVPGVTVADVLEDEGEPQEDLPGWVG